MTEKENFEMILRGEQPEWVPLYSVGPREDGKPAPVSLVFPGILSANITGVGAVQDVWGVTHVPVPEAANAKIPEPNNFILKDIRQWRDVIKAPDLTGIDWEAMAKKDLEWFQVNHEKSLVSLGLHNGYFQHLMAFMGFSEGLCAMYEEPEEVLALMEYLCDFFTEVTNKCIDYYKPDIIDMADDIAAWKNPFMSLEMYRELIKPATARQAKIYTDRGLPIAMHCCGHCDSFIDDWLDFGVKLWNPAQTSNDLDAVKKKYGNRLVICGGWDGIGELLDPDVSEETIKQSVYRTMNKYAPGGGYAFIGHYLGSIGDKAIAKKNRWLQEAANSYASTFYK